MHSHLAYPGCFSPTAGVLSEVTCAMDWKWLEPLHGSFIPNLHVHSGHSSEFSRSYCWAGLLHIRKSVNQLNKTFLDILRGGSWKKKKSGGLTALIPPPQMMMAFTKILICGCSSKRKLNNELSSSLHPTSKVEKTTKAHLCLKVS